MESALVIKVQYGNTLRRFNARVDESGSLDLDMLGLMTKICSLFPFPSDADLILTYIDEDGDVVTLVDDDDLCDVMRQQLKFLKIHVTLKNEKTFGSFARSSGSSTPLRSPRVTFGSFARSSGSSTPLRSPRVQQPLTNINAALAEAMKVVPEPLRETLSKLSLDLVSKTASSSPSFVDVVEQLTKTGQSILNPGSQPPMGTDAGNNNSAAASAMAPPPAARSPNGIPVASCTPEASGDLASKKDVAVDFVKGSVASTVAGAQVPIDLNVDPSGNPNEVQNDEKKEQCPAEPSTENVAIPHGSTVHRNYSECPFGGVALGSESNLGYSWPRLKRTCKSQAVGGGIFHRGIRCDGCGVYPITGPRFKSLVKEDYDLCSICFAEMGKEADYVRLDKPISHRDLCSSGQFKHPWFPVHVPHGMRTPGVRRGLPKLDSRFVSDVTIMDGTVMDPSTPFTKIWRMRNNGNFIWPQGTQLVWIGGDRFSERDSVEIEIPFEGIPVDEELDIAVDFISPNAPGRYLSYWRMASPSGQKYGQRVWLLIQVDASLGDPLAEKLEGLNLNLPPLPVNGLEINAPSTGSVDTYGAGNNLSSSTEPVRLLADEQKEDQEHNFPINDNLLVGHGSSASAPPESSFTISYPKVELSDVPPVWPSPLVAASGNANVVGDALPSGSTNGADSGGDAVEASLLKELEEMGFKQVDLNKEILRMNDYNLEQSVDELCGVAEWDPILEELREMGFCDKEMNKRLLQKNNGSIKGVVMDLLSGEDLKRA